MTRAIDTRLREYVPGRIWTKKYAVRYSGCDFPARTTLIRLASGDVLVHSPGPIDASLTSELASVGHVAHIVAPGNFHHFHVAAWQRVFPGATVWICPGVERKQPDLQFDWILGDRPPGLWCEELDQVLVRGSRIVWEVAFLDKPSKTLILTDLVENIGDDTDGTNWVLRFWWKIIMRMWNLPKPAPEYQVGWKNKAAAKRSLERILAWNFERMIVAHGENIEREAKQALREAWARPLAFK